MPATLLSHQALVLPLKMRWPRRFSGLALCIGSMAPDLEFIGRMSDDWLFSHTLFAQLWFTIPLTFALVWLITRLLVPALLPYLREVTWLRLHDIAAIEPPVGVRGWVGVSGSAYVGGVSHVVLDGVTHGNHSGWLVPSIPMLRMHVPHFGGPVPLYDALQCWLTVVFAIATLWMWRTIARDRLLWRWRSRDVKPNSQMPRSAGVQLMVLCALAAMQGAVVGRVLHDGTNTKGVAAAVAFGAIDFVFGALVLAAMSVQALGLRATPSVRNG